MFGTYSRLVEIGGFGLLIAASLWDWRAIVSRRDLPDGVSWIEAGALGDRLERHPKPVIVDVRGPDEFTGPLGHIPEALNLPLDALSHDLTEIKALQERPVILVCRTDKRSATASALLRQAGFPDVRVLRGGMEQWNRTGLPVDSRAASGPA
jgi:rhodanese-related sulfurtransferase